MSNIGGIEKIMVFGILVIIVSILGIAFYSAIKVENDLNANRVKAAGQTAMLDFDNDLDNKTDLEESGAAPNKSLFKDVHKKGNALPLKSNTAGQEDGAPTPLIIESGRDVERDGGSEKINKTANTNTNGAETKKEKNSVSTLKTYTIKKGDSLMQIARVHLGDARKYKDILTANPGLDPNRLKIGQKIFLPNLSTSGPSTESLVTTPVSKNRYVVKKGDSLVSIAVDRYGRASEWRKIWQANLDVLPDPDMLKIDMVLKLP